MTKNNNPIRTAWPTRRRAFGFTSLDAMIAAAVIGVVAIGGQQLYARYKQDQVAEARGKQFGVALGQLDKFARKFQTQLTAGQTIVGVANAYAPTMAELSTMGFAPVNYSDTSQPGGALRFIIAREPAGCAAAKCILSLQVVTSGSVQRQGAPDLNFAQQIAGYVPNGAGWSNLPGDSTKLGKNGRTIPNPLGNTPAVVAGALWLGSSQASKTVPPVSYNYRSIGCPAGYTGSKDQKQSVTTDKWGNVTTGSWVTYYDGCDYVPPPPPPPAPTCSNGASDYPTCTPPYTAPATCANGASDYPTCTPPSTTPSTTPTTCANGASNYPTCTPPTCSNGGSDYPTCTPPNYVPPPPPPPPPPAPVCTSTDKWAIPQGTGTHTCTHTTTTCCDGTCNQKVEYGKTYGYTGICELN